jgi:hypothetical protein
LFYAAQADCISSALTWLPTSSRCSLPFRLKHRVVVIFRNNDPCSSISKELLKQRKGQHMRRIMAISTALPLLLAGALTASAQTPSPQTPQEPRGEESSQSANPSGQLTPTPSERREQRSTPGTSGVSPRGQSTPQEPRGEESERSAFPRGEQPREK